MARRSRAAVGFSVHTGWAVAVVMAGPKPQVLSRHKVILAKDDSARFVFHQAAEKPKQAQKLIAASEKDAILRAKGFFEQLKRELPEHGLVVALPRPKKVLPELAKILAAHPLIHTAEGELFREAIARGAEQAGVEVITAEPGVDPAVGKMNPPWGKDQRSAAALAWSVLSTRT